MKQNRPFSVNATPRIVTLISGLSDDDPFRIKIDNALDKLKENFFVGNQVEKSKIPRFYVTKYHVSNLFVLRLDLSRRLIYTLISNKDGIAVIIVDIFLDHKAYETRFGYD